MQKLIRIQKFSVDLQVTYEGLAIVSVIPV